MICKQNYKVLYFKLQMYYLLNNTFKQIYEHSQTSHKQQNLHLTETL